MEDDYLEKVLNEIGWRIATIPRKSNMNAQHAIDTGNEYITNSWGIARPALQQRKRSSEMDYKVLTLAVKDNVGANFVLTFGREETDYSTSTVVFTFQKVILLTNERFVIEGECYTSRSPVSISTVKPKRMQVDYLFDKHAFYEAIYRANRTVRDLKQLKLDKVGNIGKNNIETSDKLISLMSDCIQSIEQEHNDLHNAETNENINK